MQYRSDREGKQLSVLRIVGLLVNIQRLLNRLLIILLLSIIVVVFHFIFLQI